MNLYLVQVEDSSHYVEAENYRGALVVFEERWKCAVDDEEGEPEIECISLVCDPGAIDPPVIRRAAPGTSPPAVLLVPVSELVRVADEALIKASEHWPPSRSIFADAFRRHFEAILTDAGVGIPVAPDVPLMPAHLREIVLDTDGALSVQGLLESFGPSGASDRPSKGGA